MTALWIYLIICPMNDGSPVKEYKASRTAYSDQYQCFNEAGHAVAISFPGCFATCVKELDL